MAAAHLCPGLPHQHQQIAGLLEIHRHRARDIFDHRERRDQQAGRNGERSGRCPEFVVQAVLAGNKGSAERHGRIVAAPGGLDERAESFGAGGITPAEIVQDSCFRGVSSASDNISNSLVDGGNRHPIGIDISIARIHTTTDGDPAQRIVARREDDPVPGTIRSRPLQRLDDAAALDLVIILTNHPFLRGDIGSCQYLPQQRRGREASARLRSLHHLRLAEDRGKVRRWPAVEKEVDSEITDLVAVIEELQLAIAGKLADVRTLHALRLGQGFEFRVLLRRDSEDHALLCLRNPDLPITQAFVF